MSALGNFILIVSRYLINVTSISSIKLVCGSVANTVLSSSPLHSNCMLLLLRNINKIFLVRDLGFQASASSLYFFGSG